MMPCQQFTSVATAGFSTIRGEEESVCSHGSIYMLRHLRKKLQRWRSMPPRFALRTFFLPHVRRGHDANCRNISGAALPKLQGTT